jgi:hypothetical protein
MKLALGQLSSSNCLFIFGCAGIYDSSWSALHKVYNQASLERPLSASEPPHTPGGKEGKTNWIHSFDLSRAVLSSMLPERSKKNETQQGPAAAVRVYSLADNLPEYRGVILEYAKELSSGMLFSLPWQRSVTPLTAVSSRLGRQRAARAEG